MVFYLVVLALIAVPVLWFFSKKAPAPFKVPENGYFGSGTATPDDESIEQFKISVPDEVLEDLKARIRNTRISHKQLEDVPDFSYGFNLATLLKFKAYWLEGYDWNKAQAQLNAFSHFRTQIEGLSIHFVHAKPDPKKYSRVVPLLLVHGWPGNVYEFYKMIPMLTDPNSHLDKKQDYAFEVVAPSIPGYGWSEASHKTGMNTLAVARIFKKLMRDRLKFDKFAVQGGDWGSGIVSVLGQNWPQHVLLVHVNMAFALLKGFSWKVLYLNFFGSYFPKYVFEDYERFKDFSFKDRFVQMIKESGYMHLQATKPDTVGVALNDSPIGLMAYILEKFSGWTNPEYTKLEDGGLEKRYTKDELLTIVMIYWINGNILSSQRLYKESLGSPQLAAAMAKPFTVPYGYAGFAGDLAVPPPREFLPKTDHLKYYDDGGHFAAFELPKTLAADVFAFFDNVDSA